MIRKLARKPSPELSLQIVNIEEQLGKQNAPMHLSLVEKHLGVKEKFVSTHNTRGCWSLIKKIRPKHSIPIPVGKFDKNGKLVTDQKGLKQLYLETFVWRLRDRPIRPDLADIETLKSQLFKSILKSCMNKKTQPWTMYELESVLSGLKRDKCRDPKGLINELFLPETAGKDLKASLLILFNRIKESNEIPTFMKIADITAIYKGKGSKNELKNERGIFIVSTYRSIFMKLLYKDKNETIENHMSSSQIGGRKKMNIRNQLWVLNAVIQDTLKQCFDGLSPEESLCDLFKYGVQDHTINFLYDACKTQKLQLELLLESLKEKTLKKMPCKVIFGALPCVQPQ